MKRTLQAPPELSRESRLPRFDLVSAIFWWGVVLGILIVTVLR